MTLRSLTDAGALDPREAGREALRRTPGPMVGTVRVKPAVTTHLER